MREVSNKVRAEIFSACVANADNPYPQLANLCIQENIPLSTLVLATGISRPTLYSWITGATVPDGTNRKARHLEKLHRILLKAKADGLLPLGPGTAAKKLDQLSRIVSKYLA
jgi:hypothetical protein